MLTKTNIEYGEMNWQIFRGCLNKPQGHCPIPNCWAEKVSNRQGWDFHKPELLAKNLLDPLRRKKPTRILVNFSGDLFGDWVDEQDEYPHPLFRNQPHVELLAIVLDVVRLCPQHTFLFLTKRPDRIWNVEWPDNCWMGATAWDDGSFWRALSALNEVNARHKWLSIEPCLGRIAAREEWQKIAGCEIKHGLHAVGVEWVVIGAQTNPSVHPEVDWVRDLVHAADAAHIPVWLKDNLDPHLGVDDGPFYGDEYQLRHELPTRDTR